MTQLPRITETAPGVFSGRDVNALLLPQDVPVLLDVFGNILGGPFASIFLQRINQLNGYDNTVNAYNYENRVVPGSFSRPFVKTIFWCSTVSATTPSGRTASSSTSTTLSWP